MFSNKDQQDDGLPPAENLAFVLVKMSFERMKKILEKLLLHLFFSFSKFEHSLLFFSGKNFTIKVEEHFSKKYYHLIRFLQQLASLPLLPNLMKNRVFVKENRSLFTRKSKQVSYVPRKQLLSVTNLL